MDCERRLFGRGSPDYLGREEKGFTDDNEIWLSKISSADCTKAEIAGTLKSTIETEIIPRLMMVHSDISDWVPRSWNQNWDLTHDQIETFTKILLEQDDSEVVGFVEKLRQQGAPLDRIYIELLAPAARLLGEFWVEDRCHFADVTIGLARIQELLRYLNPDFESERGYARKVSSAVLTVASQEQHTCGMFMVGEFFRREGWSVWCGAPQKSDEIANLVGKQWFEVAGFSLSREGLFDTLKDEVDAVRRASKNPDIQIMVGGKAFMDTPALIGDIGADSFSRTGDEAVMSARKLLEISV